MTKRASVLRQHIPSLTEKAETAIEAVYLEAEDGVEYADVAIRECKCGLMVDGFYEDVAHLEAVFEKEGVS